MDKDKKYDEEEKNGVAGKRGRKSKIRRSMRRIVCVCRHHEHLWSSVSREILAHCCFKAGKGNCKGGPERTSISTQHRAVTIIQFYFEPVFNHFPTLLKAILRAEGTGRTSAAKQFTEMQKVSELTVNL